MSSGKISGVRLKGGSGNDAATELLQASVEGCLDALVKGDNCAVVTVSMNAVEARSVDDVDFDIGVTFEDIDDTLHLRVAAALVEDLQGMNKGHN